MRADTVDCAAALYPDVVGNLGTMLSASAERAASLLPAATQVLDAGAGAAPWSLAYAARHPNCLVTAIDLPAIMPVTDRAVADAGLEKQFQLVPGDLFEIELPSSKYDLAIVGNICHLFDEIVNRRLLGRLYEALTPGGMLAIAVKLQRELAEYSRVMGDPSNSNLSVREVVDKTTPSRQAGASESIRFDQALANYRQVVDQCQLQTR